MLETYIFYAWLFAVLILGLRAHALMLGALQGGTRDSRTRQRMYPGHLLVSLASGLLVAALPILYPLVVLVTGFGVYKTRLL